MGRGQRRTTEGWLGGITNRRQTVFVFTTCDREASSEMWAMWLGFSPEPVPGNVSWRDVKRKWSAWQADGCWSLAPSSADKMSSCVATLRVGNKVHEENWGGSGSAAPVRAHCLRAPQPKTWYVLRRMCPRNMCQQVKNSQVFGSPAIAGTRNSDVA